MRSDAADVDAYLDELPPERREAVAAVRDVILRNLPQGFEERIQYGMIGYVVPLERFSDTYNGEPLSLAALASQKRHMALYLMGVYGGDDESFRERWLATGRKLDMGKSCVRFKKLDDVALDVIGAAIAKVPVDKFIECVEAARAGHLKKKASPRKKAAKKK